MSELEFKTYLVDYYLDGVPWSIAVRASSPQDAMRRLRQAATWGRCAGEIQAVVPAAVPGAGLLVRMITWWKNQWR